jgi:SAM-dependent methyltransferase
VDHADDALDVLLRDQIAYYQARAGEYDVVYNERQGLGRPESLLEGLPIRGEVLELACGTGQWTRLLARRARHVTAVDAAPAALEIARQRVGALPVEFVRADVLTLRPERRFDTVFFGFWLSHVPPVLFAAFWQMVGEALATGGHAIFIDDHPDWRRLEEELPGQPAPAVRRRLDDGSEHRAVKVYYTDRELQTKLAALSWSATVRAVGTKVLIGVAQPA